MQPAEGEKQLMVVPQPLTELRVNTGGFREVKLTYERSQQVTEFLSAYIKGQEEACSITAKMIVLGESPLREPDKPLGSAFFLGPTGTGKTELAKTIGRFLYRYDGPEEAEKHIIRIDCGRYREAHNAQLFTGSPPGYVDGNVPPVIPHNFLKAGRNVVIFDEVEKAHPDVINYLLSVLDEGELMARNPESRGIFEPLDFTSSFVIFTSNIGSGDMARIVYNKSIGFLKPQEADKEKAIRSVGLQALERYFSNSPEFLGRVQEKVVFSPITDPGIYLEILSKFQREKDRMIVSQNLPCLLLSSQLQEVLVKDTLNHPEGARYLKKLYTRFVMQPYSALITEEYETIKSIAGVLLDYDGTDVVVRVFDKSNIEEQTEKMHKDLPAKKRHS